MVRALVVVGEASKMIAAAFAGYAIGIAIAFVRVVLRYPPWKH